MTDQIRHTDRHPVSNLFLFLLIAIFALFSLFVSVLGIRVYQNVSDANDDNAQIRSSVLYITNKIRSADAVSDVSVEQVDGTDVLVLNGYFESDDYELLIYYEDGAIRETIRQVGYETDLSEGETIVEAQGLTIKEEDNSIAFQVTALSGNTYSMHVFLDSSRQVDDE
jgi:hypothetical protein